MYFIKNWISQTLFSGSQWLDKKQQALTEIWEVPEYKESLYCEGDRHLD